MAPIALTNEEKNRLLSITRSRTSPHGVVRRAGIVLACAEGETNAAIAQRMGLNPMTVGKWRRRYREGGLEGLYDEKRPGRPRLYDEDRVTEVINTVLQTRPPGAMTHWSVRSVAKQTKISKSTIHHWLKLLHVQPHRQSYYKLSTDPHFVEKVRDVVGLYLNPPEHAVVLCVDEKTQIQALERTQLELPMARGHAASVTHDYRRHGTTTLFAALDVATGEVLTQCKQLHRHQEFLGFLRRIDANVPEALDVHLVMDNYATHKHAKVKAWLARRPRYHVHFIPTYSSWLNQVERWFGLITHQAIRRGSFSSVKQLIRSIDDYVEYHNAQASPFAWVATADSILAKVKRVQLFINRTRH